MIREVTSASNIPRRALCEGSERMETGLDEEDSEQSREGTLLHKHDADPALSRAKLTRAQRDLLETAAKLDKEVYRRVGEQFGINDLVGAGGREQTWWLHRGIKSLFPGHPDLFDYWKELKLLLIIDKKFGYKVVTHATANLQLRPYGCMGAELYDCDHVVVAITQPRLGFDDRITMAVYSREDIKASREQLFAIWDACKVPDAPLVAGEEQCQYCLARSKGCPAFEEKVREGLSIVPFPSGELTVRARTAAIEERISQASDEQLERMHTAATLVGFAKDPLFNEIRKRIKSGGMTNFKLGKESDVRNVTDVGIAVDLLVGVGLPRDKVMATLSMSLGDDGGVAEVYRDIKKGTKKETKDEINTLLASVLEKHKKRPGVERVK